MRSMPIPVRAMMRRRGPMRSSTSPVIVVVPLRRMASAADASAYQSLSSPTSLTKSVASPSSTASAAGCSLRPDHTSAMCISPFRSSVACFPDRAQVLRRPRDHTAEIRRDSDHLEALPHAFSRALPIAAHDAGRDGVLARHRFNALQRFHEFGLRTLHTRKEAELRMQVVRSHERYIDARHGENDVQILHGLCALDLDDHQDLFIRLPDILVPIACAKSVGSERAADAARAQRRIFRPRYDELS